MKLILINVLSVPKIKKNLVFANLFCKKGANTAIESGNVILSKGKISIEKWYSCDGMYKLSINKINSDSGYIMESFTLWYNRLAQLNFKSLWIYV